jgi:hypothetical protein
MIMSQITLRRCIVCGAEFDAFMNECPKCKINNKELEISKGYKFNKNSIKKPQTEGA